MKCAVFLAKGFEDCEALITIDMLRRAGIPTESVSITDDLKVEASHGVTMFADRLWEEIDVSEYDTLILPGGRVPVRGEDSIAQPGGQRPDRDGLDAGCDAGGHDIIHQGNRRV